MIIIYSAQVRQNDDELIPTVILIPRVCLSVMGMNGMQCATNVLDDDQLDGWQWVEGVLNFTALGISRNNSMTMVRVELYADRTGAATASSGEVFFDNICVEPLFAAVVGEYSLDLYASYIVKIRAEIRISYIR